MASAFTTTKIQSAFRDNGMIDQCNQVIPNVKSMIGTYRGCIGKQHYLNNGDNIIREFYKETYWNLNNIPNCPDSILQHIKVGINGINVPWMYFGNLFSTFCWHNEDNYLYSINYHHWGAPKQWYGIPGTKEDAEGLEKVFKS